MSSDDYRGRRADQMAFSLRVCLCCCGLLVVLVLAAVMASASRTLTSP